MELNSVRHHFLLNGTTVPFFLISHVRLAVPAQIIGMLLGVPVCVRGQEAKGHQAATAHSALVSACRPRVVERITRQLASSWCFDHPPGS
jgi:hypothetical protein